MPAQWLDKVTRQGSGNMSCLCTSSNPHCNIMPVVGPLSCRCMSSKLQEMHQQCLSEGAASDASRTQRLVAQCCLASFLSFLSFAASASSSSTTHSNIGNSHFLPSMDLSAALLAAVQGNKLAWVVPWMTHYLRFLADDSFAQSSGALQQLLPQLHSLHTTPMLLPSHPGFGPVELCVRCVLDDHLERVQEMQLNGEPPDASWTEALQEMQGVGGEPGRLSGDSRLMQLCCPTLEAARQALQVICTRRNLSSLDKQMQTCVCSIVRKQKAAVFVLQHLPVALSTRVRLAAANASHIACEKLSFTGRSSLKLQPLSQLLAWQPPDALSLSLQANLLEAPTMDNQAALSKKCCWHLGILCTCCANLNACVLASCTGQCLDQCWVVGQEGR